MRNWLRHRKAALCWRCEKVAVASHGRACADCLTVLYAEYDAKLAANGGQLLYLPRDWDGSAVGWGRTVVDLPRTGDGGYTCPDPEWSPGNA